MSRLKMIFRGRNTIFILYYSQPFYNNNVCPQIIYVKLYFGCNELKFKLNWYICANTNVVKNFAVIKSISIKSIHPNNPRHHHSIAIHTLDHPKFNVSNPKDEVFLGPGRYDIGQDKQSLSFLRV